MKAIKLEKFEGPLDLLLQLIEQEKLNITEIALSKVTEQYFEHLNKLEESRPEELADFLVVATKLVYLKSKTLLPYLTPEEDEGPSLADQLRMYKRYVEASHEINRRWEAGRLAYGRLEPPVKPEGFVLPANAHSADLREAFVNLLKRLKPVTPLPKVTVDRAVSVKQKLDTLLNFLKQRRRFNFSEILSQAKNRTEIIVSFIALLELVKTGVAAARQNKSFEDLEISKI